MAHERSGRGLGRSVVRWRGRIIEREIARSPSLLPSIETFPDDYESPDERLSEFAGRTRATAAGEDLVAQVREAFTEGGVLSRAAEQFRERDGQTQMALAVAETIDAGGVLVVEAGTGVGKTFSYLVPALLSGERVLLSTAT